MNSTQVTRSSWIYVRSLFSNIWPFHVKECLYIHVYIDNRAKQVFKTSMRELFLTVGKYVLKTDLRCCMGYINLATCVSFVYFFSCNSPFDVLFLLYAVFKKYSLYNIIVSLLQGYWILIFGCSFSQVLFYFLGVAFLF